MKKDFPEIEFAFVYTKEAHPDDGPDRPNKDTRYGGWRMPGVANKVDTHKTYEERVEAAKVLRKAGKKGWHVFVDDMDSTLQQTWGKLPNSSVLVNPQGRIEAKWSWTQMCFDTIPRRMRKNGEKNVTLRKVLDKKREAGELKPYTIADDTLLPLRDTVDGEWLSYTLSDGTKETVRFDKASTSSVDRVVGDHRTTIQLDAADLSGERIEPEHSVETIKNITLPCIVVSSGEVSGVNEVVYSPWLPGDGIVKVVKDGVVIRTLTDAGFEKGESCLVPYDPSSSDKSDTDKDGGDKEPDTDPEGEPRELREQEF